jgi:hypothetical protein
MTTTTTAAAITKAIIIIIISSTNSQLYRNNNKTFFQIRTSLLKNNLTEIDKNDAAEPYNINNIGRPELRELPPIVKQLPFIKDSDEIYQKEFFQSTLDLVYTFNAMAVYKR